MSLSALRKEELYEQAGLEVNSLEPESVGLILKRARENLNETIEVVAQSLRISQNYLEALEAGDTERLPELVYTIGFLKTYARHLGLNEEELVKLYKSQFFKIHKKETLEFPVPAPERHLPNKWLMIIATGLACLIAAAWIYLQPWDVATTPSEGITPEVALQEGTRQIPEVEYQDEMESAENISNENDESSYEIAESKVLPSESGPIFPISDTRSLKETKAADLTIEGKDIYLGQGETLIIMVSQPSWLEIKTAGGETLINQTLPSGESKEIKAQEGLTLSTGNAGGLSLYLNNKYFSPLGKIGQVMSGYNLVFADKPRVAPTSSN